MQLSLLRAMASALVWNLMTCTADARHIHGQSSLAVDAQDKEAAPNASSRQFERVEFGLLAVSTSIQQKLHDYLQPLSGAAVVTTIALQLSPLPSTLEIRRDKSVKRYDGYPYFSVLAGASQWCIYGAFSAWKLHDKTLLTMLAANGPGVVMGLFYIWSYFQYVPAEDPRRLSLKRYLQVGCILLCGEFAICCLFGRSAVFMLGLLGSVGSAQIALSPFKTLPEVLRTRSTRSWPLDLCLWNFIQSMATGGFGLANSDPWVWVPNVIGVLAAIVQMTLIVMYASDGGAAQSSKIGAP
jgi:solute carrier family 50 protein (sugar transporter)